MWKLVVGFVLFAALALYVISKGGDSLDMSGEKHGTETHAEPHPPAAAASAATVAPAASAAAPAAEAPASAAK